MELMETSATNANHAKTNDQKREVPTLSLAAYTQGSPEERAHFVENLARGFKEYGFVILKDHGVDTALFDRGYEILERVFRMPTEAKLKYVPPSGDGQRGYTPFGREHAKDSPVMDLKEFWHVGRELPADHPDKAHQPDNIWPQEAPEFRPLFLSLFEQLEKAGAVMLEALTGPLKVEKDFFAKMIHNGSSVFRLLHYPPIPEGTDPRCLRAAPHEDINFITILPAATSAGLQLKDRDGRWLDVNAENGTLIVDAGDMLARLTNDVIPSTTHQVVNSPGAVSKSRYSMPFFMHPRPDAMLSCLPSCRGEGAKHADITAGEFLYQRLVEIGLIKPA
ncbi:MAG: isopenicillin N synthase family oxygenase [Bdellovibrionaceae bacterium]|nr:isopenicillin N synthase family oxygenase [Pseudobdellovibrionaceae bacterium]